MQQVEASDGTFAEVHKIRRTTIGGEAGFRLYTAKAGDTFESLASREYSDARKWYVIADANPDIFFPLELTPGMQVVIPSKTFAVLT